MEQNLCIFTEAFMGEASENLSTEMVHEEQEREWTEEKTSFQDREHTWKLLYEQKKQEFEKAAQEWKSREQLLLKLLREKTNPCITIDIEERFNVLNPQPKVTHLNDHVTQIELGQSGDSFYYSVVTITVEKSGPPEDVLGAPSETVEEPTATEVEEVQEISGTVTGVISLEGDEGEMTKADVEEDAANCTTGPHDESVVDIIENNISTLAEPDASLSLVHVPQFDEVQAEDGATKISEKKRKNRTKRNKKEGKTEMQKKLWQEQLEAYHRMKEKFEVQKTSAAELNEVQATQETQTEAELTSNSVVHDSNTINRKRKNKKNKYKTMDEMGSSDVLEDCFSCFKCPNEEQEETTETEEPLCEKVDIQDPTTTSTKRRDKNKSPDVSEDWFTSFTIEEPEETEAEVTSNNVVEETQCEKVEIQDSTATTRKKKKRNKKTDGTEYSNKVRYNTQKYYDQYDDYEDVLLQGRKARTRVKNVAVASTRYSDYEDHGGKKRNKRDWD